MVIVLFFLSSHLAIAQSEKDSIQNIEDSKTPNRYFNAEISGILPFGIGDNFASEGMTFRYGFELNFKGYFNDHIFIGLKFQHLRAKVSETSIVGFFEHSNLNTYIVMAGYRFKINNNFNIEPYIGYGSTVYRNKKTSTTLETVDFFDEANTLIFATSLAYKFSDNLSVFMSPEYRTDFTKIKTAPQRQNFFDKAKFINVLVGFRIGY